MCSQAACQLYNHGDMTAKRIAEIVGISRASLYRAPPQDSCSIRATGTSEQGHNEGKYFSD